MVLKNLTVDGLGRGVQRRALVPDLERAACECMVYGADRGAHVRDDSPHAKASAPDALQGFVEAEERPEVRRLDEPLARQRDRVLQVVESARGLGNQAPA